MSDFLIFQSRTSYLRAKFNRHMKEVIGHTNTRLAIAEHKFRIMFSPERDKDNLAMFSIYSDDIHISNRGFAMSLSGLSGAKFMAKYG